MHEENCHSLLICGCAYFSWKSKLAPICCFVTDWLLHSSEILRSDIIVLSLMPGNDDVSAHQTHGYIRFVYWNMTLYSRYYDV